jgi:hypothetical protein
LEVNKTLSNSNTALYNYLNKIKTKANVNNNEISMRLTNYIGTNNVSKNVFYLSLYYILVKLNFAKLDIIDFKDYKIIFTEKFNVIVLESKNSHFKYNNEANTLINIMQNLNEKDITDFFQNNETTLIDEFIEFVDAKYNTSY